MNKRTTSIAAVIAAASLTLAACGGQDNTNSGSGSTGGNGGLSGAVAIDGSSTVAPLSEAAATGYRDEAPGVNVTVATSGTGGGFKKFCSGETDISDASRPIKDEEKAECEKNGVAYSEIIISNDGLSVVVNPENDWAQCLTVEQLSTIWAPESEGKVMTWDQVDPSFPKEELALFGAGTDSGTFDYFTDEINGEEGAIRTDYSPSEDDNITVQGVQGAKGAMGFFGLSYAEENKDAVKLVQIDGGEGCVTPSKETVQDGSYSPLGRPLFIYVSNKSVAEKPQVKDFVTYYVENSVDIAAEAGFVPLTDEQKKTAADQLAAAVQ
ncbi:PstS family phosphate ABC transporter substrate-binding protein [Intrasporangium sp.]|uniref:PstS family phosphate ABC transporter substrate-binding protein n=1 Tax=Intrasporangium sp. TaxID=1925024 RepID=UPI00293A7570|nr:PstS family phosphate ABC transporter substrate-binding protein [Intrasporangium sp.]MDV3223269.1 PstS family phosphate ABC transporter substrate-binding protein [Intrasporangium sp.]